MTESQGAKCSGRSSSGPLPPAPFCCVFGIFPFVWTGTKIFPSPLSVAEGHRRTDAQACALGRHRRLASPRGHWLRRCCSDRNSDWPLPRLVPAANQVVNPLLQILRPISPIAWIPVAIIFFGVGDPAAIFLIFLGALFPIVVACVRRRGERAVSLPARRTQLRARPHPTCSARSSFPPRCRRSSSACASRSASHGWWLLRPR